MQGQGSEQIDSSGLEQMAALWNADPNSIKLVSDGINWVYRFEVAAQGRYLRITRPNMRSVLELTAAIDYQRHLFANGAPVCEPLTSKNDTYIEEIIWKGQSFLAHVTAEVPGKIIDLIANDLKVYESWGKALGKLHQAAASYQAPKDLHFLSWRDLWVEALGYLAKEDEVIKQEYQAVDRWAQNLSSDPVVFGLTHGDHRAGNALYDGEQVHIIDFDEPVYHWFVADIARSFLEVSDQPLSSWDDKLQAYLSGYRTIRSLSDKEITVFPGLFV